MKKTFIYVMTACLAMSFNACGGGESGTEGENKAKEENKGNTETSSTKEKASINDIKEMKKNLGTKSTFTNEELGQYIAFTGEDAEITLTKEGFFAKNKVTLIKKIEMIDKFTEEEISRHIMGDFTISLLDKNGNTLSNLSARSEKTQEVLAKLLLGEEGDVAELEYKGSIYDFEDANTYINNFNAGTSYEISGNVYSLIFDEIKKLIPGNGNITVENVVLPASLNGKVKVLKAGEVTMDKHGFPSLTVTFELIETVNTKPLASAYGQLWIVGVAQDEIGATITELMPNYNEWRTEDNSGDQAKAFLEGEPGDTLTLTFTGANNIELFEKDNEKIKAGNEKTKAGIEKMYKFKIVISK